MHDRPCMRRGDARKWRQTEQARVSPFPRAPRQNWITSNAMLQVESNLLQSFRGARFQLLAATFAFCLVLTMVRACPLEAVHSRLLRTTAGHVHHLATYFRNPGAPWPHRMQQWHSTSQTLSLFLCALVSSPRLHAGTQWVMLVSSRRTGHACSLRPLPHRPASSRPDCACRFAPSWLCAFVTLRFRIHVGWETVSRLAVGALTSLCPAQSPVTCPSPHAHLPACVTLIELREDLPDVCLSKRR
jgi:hypothetical protein